MGERRENFCLKKREKIKNFTPKDEIFNFKKLLPYFNLFIDWYCPQLAHRLPLRSFVPYYQNTSAYWLIDWLIAFVYLFYNSLSCLYIFSSLNYIKFVIKIIIVIIIIIILVIIVVIIRVRCAMKRVRRINYFHCCNFLEIIKHFGIKR